MPRKKVVTRAVVISDPDQLKQAASNRYGDRVIGEGTLAHPESVRADKRQKEENPRHVAPENDWHDNGCVKRYGAVSDQLCACEVRKLPQPSPCVGGGEHRFGEGDRCIGCEIDRADVPEPEPTHTSRDSHE